MGSAEFVLSQINLRGADAVSHRVDSDENFGRSVLSGIATGDTLWLEVARKITPSSAAAEASVSIALASALTRSPDRVLRLLGDKYPVDEVCGMPFLRADSLAVVAYYDSANASLQRVDSAFLRPARDSCRAALADARDRRLERINPAYIVKNKPVAPPRLVRVRRKAAKANQPVTPQDTSSSE